MNLDALRAASARLAFAQDAVRRDDKEGATRHLLGLQAALAEMHEPRRRRRTDHTVARLERVSGLPLPCERDDPLVRC
jgi:tellurite resistance protein